MTETIEGRSDLCLAPPGESTSSGVVIRPARQSDIGSIVAMVHALAAHVGSASEVQLQDEGLEGALFEEAPSVFSHVAQIDGEVVGFTLWFINYSTWQGLHGIYLEDFYVVPEARRLGAGRRLIQELASLAIERGYGRIDWCVTTSNEQAKVFYRSLGAGPNDEVSMWRLSGAALEDLTGSRFPIKQGATPFIRQAFAT